jgi:hypothetical protein
LFVLAPGKSNSPWQFEKMSNDYFRNNGISIKGNLRLTIQTIAPIVEATAKEFGYTYNLKSTFLGTLYSHIHRLKDLGYPTKQHIVTKQTVTMG